MSEIWGKLPKYGDYVEPDERDIEIARLEAVVKGLRESLATTAECFNCNGCRDAAREALEKFK